MANESLFHIILNIISLIITFLGLIISTFILIIVYLRRKHFYDVKSLLCINNYLIVFFIGILLLFQNIYILKEDFRLNSIEYETLGCRIRGYILFSFLSAMYQAFVLQAIFRLNRIVHRSHRSCFKYRHYLIIIPILWIISFILMSPLFILHGQKLISGEHVCLISKDDKFSIAYSTLIIYAIPSVCIAFIYFRVSFYLHSQTKSNNQLFNNNKRDIIVLRRIIILVILLFSYGFPQSMMLIHLAITNRLVSCFYRFLMLSFAACVFTQSLAIIYVTPHFRRNLFRLRRKKKPGLISQGRLSQPKTNGTHSTSSNIAEHSF